MTDSPLVRDTVSTKALPSYFRPFSPGSSAETAAEPSTSFLERAPARTSTFLLAERGELNSSPDLLSLLDQIKALWRVHGGPSVAPCFCEAFEFAGALELNLPRPIIWTDGEAEVAFEWIGAGKHAIVSLEGDGSIGYAYLEGDTFVPGQTIGLAPNVLPSDLRSYLIAR